MYNLNESSLYLKSGENNTTHFFFTQCNLCKIYEMVLLNSLESFAKDKGLFSGMQFGFREGVGCTDTSFTILEAINHMIERGSNVFPCFLDVRKAFDTAWIDGLLFMLFFEFGIRGRMWFALRSLYTAMKAHVLCFGSLSRKFEILQGTGQGRLPPPFMYKVNLKTSMSGLLKIKLSAYANDTTLFVKDSHSLHRFLKLMGKFQEFSSLKLSVDKCEAGWVGGAKTCRSKLVRCK